MRGNTAYIEEILHIIQPVIEHNVFWAHPENVLLSAIFDNDTSFKQIAISKSFKQGKSLDTYVSPM